MPGQGCCSADVCRWSGQSGSKGKLTLETILLTAVWAKLPVLSDDRVGCQMLAPRLAREVENKATNKQVVRQWLHSQMDEPVGIL